MVGRVSSRNRFGSMIGNVFMENWTKGKVHMVINHFNATGIAQNTEGLMKEMGPKESLYPEDWLLNCLLN